MKKFLAVLFVLLSTTPLFAQDIQLISDLLNAQRRANGLGPLRHNARLTESAREHATDMAQHGFISHTGTDGSRPHERSRRHGYCWQSHAENIAWGIHGEQAVITGWMGSHGHRANILKSNVNEFGVARVGPGDIWVLTLGRGRNC